MLSSRVARVLGTDLGNIQCIWGVQSVLSRSLATLHATCLSSAAVSASAQRCDGATQSSNAASTRVECHIKNLQHPQLDTSGHQQQLAVQQQQQRLGHALSTDLQSQHLSQWPWQQQPCGLMQQQPRQQLPPQQQWRRSSSSSSGVPGSAEDGSPKWRVYPSGPQQQPGIQPAAVARAASSMQQPQAAGNVAPEADWVIQVQAQQQQQYGWQLDHQPQAQPAQHVDLEEQHFPAEALHLGAEVDVGAFYKQHKYDFENAWPNPPHKDQYIFALKNSSEDQDMLKINSKGPPAHRYMIVYRYGSVIFINVSEAERAHCLAMLKPFAVPAHGQVLAPPDESGLRMDKTIIVVRPTLKEWSQLEADSVVVQILELASMRVISHVLAQSVALDYFNSRVDSAIQQFTPYLEAVAKMGAEKDFKEAGLLQLIAENSLLYTDVVTKIGLLDISPTAWKNDKHFKLWEDLRRDYEIERRFNAIDRKLGPMLENAKFLLDVRQEQKSSSAEWIIIGLIAMEIFINIAGHAASHFDVLH